MGHLAPRGACAAILSCEPTIRIFTPPTLQRILAVDSETSFEAFLPRCTKWDIRTFTEAGWPVRQRRGIKRVRARLSLLWQYSLVALRPAI
eukprot:5355415-Amphidinium_carterae.1